MPGLTTKAERGQTEMAVPQGMLTDRPMNLGHSFPTRPGPAPGCSSLVVDHNPPLVMDLSPRCFPWDDILPSASSPLPQLGYPRAGTEPGCFLLTVQLPGYNPLSGFSEAQGHLTQLILNKRRKNTVCLIKNSPYPISFSIYFLQKSL